MDAKTKVDLNKAELYINRELSQLEFNRRVLEQAKDEVNPLLERLKFLCIASSTLDEFFEIRVAGLHHQNVYQSGPTGPDKITPADQIKQISRVAHELVAEQYRILNEELTPTLDKEGICFLRRSIWDRKQISWAKRFFDRELMPVLSPIGLDPSHPFPRILNKSLNFLVSLEGKDAFGRDSAIAIVQAPRALPRIIKIPNTYGRGSHDFVFLSSLIHAHVEDIFPGMEVTGCYQFRVTRDSDLFVDGEESEDLLRAIEGELHQRKYGDAVRLEVANDCPLEMIKLLQQEFNLTNEAIYMCNGPVNLARLMAVPAMIDRPDLKFKTFTSSLPCRLINVKDTFDAIRRGDILLHHPFQSFAPVVEFLRQAASDPSVVVIKQTLYRTGPNSPVAKALIDAARAGKEVTVVVELRARFDEQDNIALATKLQEAGAHVVYGVVGHKTHAKMILVVRREGRQLRRYVHLGTGNYHPGTARLYSDYGLFTCNKTVGTDVQKIFHQITAPGRPGKLRKLLQSPFTLHKTILDLIERETAAAHGGQPARIIAKMNSLTEVQVIKALYRASCAGVKIELIVRGICSLRPQVEGVSENIIVRSVVGRFLEHTRVFYFYNGGKYEVYLSSADWMNRNFFNRVETCIRVEKNGLRDQIVKQGLNLYLTDNIRAWELNANGSYKRIKSKSGRRRDAQEILLEQLCP